jgi:hypothetical protein
MKLDITHMLTKSTSPFYGIIPGNAAILLGLMVQPVIFGETRENYRTEYIKFGVADFETSYHVVGVLDRQTYQGVPEVVDCAVGIVIERPRTRRYAQGHETQDLYRFGLPRWRALCPVWGIKYGALRLVLVEIRCRARYLTLLYIVQGAGS